MELNKKNYTVSETVLPVIPLRGLWMFPHMVMHFDVGRLKSINALETALLNHSQLFVTSQKDMMVEDPDENDIFSIGTIVNVKQTRDSHGPHPIESNRYRAKPGPTGRFNCRQPAGFSPAERRR